MPGDGLAPVQQPEREARHDAEDGTRVMGTGERNHVIQVLPLGREGQVGPLQEEGRMGSPQAQERR